MRGCVVDASVLARVVVDEDIEGERVRALLRPYRFDSAALAARIWELRDTLTIHDAGCIALAEALDCPLIRADRRLARAPGPCCVIEVV